MHASVQVDLLSRINVIYYDPIYQVTKLMLFSARVIRFMFPIQFVAPPGFDSWKLEGANFPSKTVSI